MSPCSAEAWSSTPDYKVAYLEPGWNNAGWSRFVAAAEYVPEVCPVRREGRAVLAINAITSTLEG